MPCYAPAAPVEEFLVADSGFWTEICGQRAKKYYDTQTANVREPRRAIVPGQSTCFIHLAFERDWLWETRVYSDSHNAAGSDINSRAAANVGLAAAAVSRAGCATRS